MRQLSVILLFLCCSTSKSQTFGEIYTNGSWTINAVQRDIDKQIEKAKKNNIIPEGFKNTIGDTLIYIVPYKLDRFTIKMTFNLNEKGTQETYCDFQEYIFDCTPCSQKHLEQFIDYLSLRQKSENIYLSSYLFQTTMTIQYKSESKDCLVLTFRHIDLQKKEYIELYKKLKKKTTS